MIYSLFFCSFWLNRHIKYDFWTALLEISDHDGYCSGNECEYESIIKIFYCNIPLEYNHYPVCTILDNNEYNWEQILLIPKINDDGSGYCELCEESKKANLYGHDYRYSIILVEIVEIN